MDGIEHDALGKRQTRINSKVKGNVNEYQAAKVITKWTGTKFARTPRSGGLRWINASMVCGDLTCEDQDFKFPFTIEVKAYKSANLDLSRINSKVYKFWEQAKEDADRAGKLPMLMVRVNGMPKDQFMVYLHLDDVCPKLCKRLKGACYGRDIVGYNSKELFESIEFPIFVKHLNKKG